MYDDDEHESHYRDEMKDEGDYDPCVEAFLYYEELAKDSGVL